MESEADIKKIAGRWRVDRELGVGGMGRVLLARGDDGGKVAIKLLGKSSSGSRARQIERFKSEFSIMKELSHPGINRVFDFGLDSESGHYFFTSEYVEGVPFLDAVKGAGVELIEDLFVQLLRALQYLHSHGMMHSDVKSANALVSLKGEGPPEAKLIDFGLAILGSPDRIMGTPSYMAPEIILKNMPDSRADLYSLGVLIYMALAGFNPFRADRTNEVFQNQINVKPGAPSRYNEKVPAYLDGIVLRLLEKKPSDRFPTAAHVIRAIDIGSGKSYPVETRETFIGYLPLEGNLVGRKKEIEEIRNQCLAVRDGRPGFAFALCVKGDVGTGKKRLLSELRYFAQLNEMDVVVLSDSGESSLAAFNGELARLMEGRTRPAVVICDAIGPLAVRAPGARTVNLIEKLVRRMRVAGALSDVKKARPVFLAFASLPDELPLLLHLLNLADDEIGMVELHNFSEGETREYLGALTGVADIPSRLVDELMKRTQGNPLFITEVMKDLANGGILFDKVGRWNREAMEDIGVHFEGKGVPQNLDGILDRVYKNALPDEKAVLEALAAWCRPVMADDVAAVSETGNSRRVLASLIKSGTVGFDVAHAAYFFNNALLNEVVYRHMPSKKRNELHRAIIERLKTINPEAHEEINWHLGRGGDVKESVDALLELGLDYLKGVRPFEALSALEEAENRSKDGEYRYDEVLLHLGESYVLARRYQDAIKTYEALLRRKARMDGELTSDYIVTCQKLGVTHLRNGNLKGARDILTDAKNLFSKVDLDDTIKLRIENLLARVAFLDGELEGAAAIYEGTKRQWSALPTERKKEVVNNDLAHVYLQMGRKDDAEREFRDDIDFFEKVGADNELERSYYALAEINLERGDADRTSEYFGKAIDIAKRISDSELLLRAYNGQGSLFRMKGDADKALYWYERALDLAVRTGEDSTAAAIILNIGLIESEKGELDLALDHFNSSVKILDRAEKKTGLDLRFLLRAHVETGEVYRLKGELDRADHFLAEAENLLGAFPVLSDQAFWIEKVKENIARDRKDVVRGAGADITEHEEIGISILDITSRDENAGGAEMDSRYYKYILEINKYLGGELDPDFVLKTILKYALELSGAQAGLILLANGEGSLEIRCGCNVEIDGNLSKVGVSIAKEAIDRNEIVITNDAVSDDRFRSMESVVILGLKSVICVPINVRRRAIGVIYLENRFETNAFEKSNRELLTAFADQTGMAIENARLMKNYEEASKRLREKLDESHLQMERLDAQVKSQVSDLKGTYQFDRLVSASPRMRKIFDLLKRISESELSVCVTGESGTGKELVAKAIHYNSQRAKGPFVVINCGAIPATLIESELFGYRAGAFTGAVRDKMGLFEAADGGTVFLDEIAELDVSLQAKLLRVIQEGEVMRVGDTKTIRCDARVVCATNRPLEQLLDGDRFRQDLYYRVAEIRIDLPALRERMEDIPILVDEFVSDYCVQHEIKKAPEVKGEFIRACMSYDWPGNIRELENAVRVATALADTGAISVAALPDNHALKRFAGGGGKRGDAGRNGGFAPPDGPDRYNPRKTWREYEAEIIASAYKSSGFNAKAAADNLKIAVATVYKKINELGLKDESNPLFRSSFKYEPHMSLDDYLLKIFRAAWDHSGRRAYRAAKLLGVSHGYFYKVKKGF